MNEKAYFYEALNALVDDILGQHLAKGCNDDHVGHIPSNEGHFFFFKFKKVLRIFFIEKRIYACNLKTFFW